MRKWAWLGGLVLLIAVTAWAILRLIRVEIAPGGMVMLTVDSPIAGGTATLHPGAAVDFALTANADAQGHRIMGAGPGVNAGESLIYGQAAGGDFTGSTYPVLTFATPPVLMGAVAMPIGALAAGACTEVNATITGATVGMVPVSNAIPLLVGVNMSARVSALNTVAVRACAVANVVLGGEVVQVAVIT